MIRLHITAEGQTERTFVEKILVTHLGQHHVFADVRCVLTSRDKKSAKEYRGGLLSYTKAKKDIQSWLKEDRHEECRFTTMFDLYALPEDFPGYAAAGKETDPYKRIATLEDAMKQDVGDRRFIPYIQLHEFEALILAAPQELDWEYLEHEKAIENLMRMMEGQNPELINEGAQTAPSKRIIREIPAYDKVTAGAMVATKIGLERLREKCRHFDEWITTLENL